MAEQTAIKQELAKIKQNQLFMVIGILLFVVMIFWVAVSLFTSQQQTKITAEQQQMAAPLQPTINTSVIDSLIEQEYYTEAELSNFTIYKIINTESGEKVVVPIDTPEEEFAQRTSQEEVEEENESSLNLLEALNTPESSTASGATSSGMLNSDSTQESPESTESVEAEN